MTELDSALACERTVYFDREMDVAVAIAIGCDEDAGFGTQCL